MTTYTLDPTGAAGANLVSGEAVPVNMIGQGLPQLVFLTQGLFSDANFVATYAGVDGRTGTLTPGDDYSFQLEIPNAFASHKLFGAVQINNMNLNGTITFAYQALGGQWRMLGQEIANVMNNSVYNRRVAFPSLKPKIPVYGTDPTTPIVLNGYNSIALAQSTGPLPVALTGCIAVLPRSKQLYVEAGLIMDGNGTVVPG